MGYTSRYLTEKKLRTWQTTAAYPNKVHGIQIILGVLPVVFLIKKVLAFAKNVSDKEEYYVHWGTDYTFWGEFYIYTYISTTISYFGSN